MLILNGIDMGIEYETKVLDIDVDAIEQRLRELNAKQEGEFLMRRWVYDIDPENEEWIRLREEGEKTTITYKRRTGTGIGETEEIETEVDEFDTIAEILSKIPFKGNYYQENKRKVYKLGSITITIDSWPMIPTYLEIEGESEEDVRKGLELLGLTGKDVGNLSVKKVYSIYGIDLHEFKELRF
jgi:adenylate cyclase class 2